MSIYEERLAEDLETIRRDLESLSSSVQTALRDGVQALLRADTSAANLVVLGDPGVNRAFRALDRACHAFVVRHLPSAGHLRFVSSVMRINVALERMGDYAVTVGRETAQISGPPPELLARDIDMIAHQALGMLEAAMRAFLESDEDLARGTRGQAYQLDVTFQRVYDELVECGEEDVCSTKDLFALLAVLTSLGRVGDVAKNICEETLFTLTGETKEPRVYNILFIDEENDCTSQLAEAVARKAFPESGRYSSAGWAPAEEVDPSLLGYAGEYGLDLGAARTDRLDALTSRLSDFHVVVSLGGDPSEHLPEIPYRTVILSWDVPARSGASPQGPDLDGLRKDLQGRIRRLMETLQGPNVD